MQVGDTPGLDPNRGFMCTQCFIRYNSPVLLLCVCVYLSPFICVKALLGTYLLLYTIYLPVKIKGNCKVV